MKIFLFLLTLYFSAFCADLAQAQCNWLPQETPGAFDSYFLISADTTFIPASLPYSLPAGSDFDTYIGRTPAQVTTRKNEAIAYFQAAFGIDFSGGDTAQNGDIELVHESIDTAWNQKIFYAGGYRIDTTGWMVSEGYYKMQVVGSSAILYGSWGGAVGETVPDTTVAYHGDIYIETSVPCRDALTGAPLADQTGTLLITYGSTRPSLARSTSIQAQDLTLSGIASGGVGYGSLRVIEDSGDITVYSHRQLKFNP